MRHTRSRLAALFLMGAVFAAPAAAQSQTGPLSAEGDNLTGALLGDAGRLPGAAEYIVGHPGAVHPYYFARVVDDLWRRGNRRQAAFWYYVFQSRSRAWAETDPNLKDLRGALNDGMGQAINSWAAGDLDAWQEIGARAISYEKKLPFYPGRPGGVSAEQWTAIVAKWRKAYEDGFLSVFPKTEQDRQAYADKRRKKGLYVGPLQNPGEPLPDDWR